MPGEPLRLADLLDHHSRQPDRLGSRACPFFLPIARNSRGVVEALNGIGEVAHEPPSAKLAVGEGPQPEILLALQHAQNMTIFKLLQLFSGASVRDFCAPPPARPGAGDCRHGRRGI